ncbi:MAG: hypothetical protein KJO76_06720 [Gammaproteobacteria bacterium]|nr:hypothetical protein [Gammaproteobacteria bacterium]MBT8443463.1 hypothetical protein [Gammaproteobacteria bacterium]NND37514.1 hypothetical protein [Gammaproteobacteria bacterium]
MFGVAEDLELSGLHGRQLKQLAVAAERIELGFDDEWRITIEGSWRLERGAEVLGSGGRGRLLDEVDKLNDIVGSTATGVEVKPPDRIVLTMADASTLTLIDDSDLLESFSIDPIGVVV